MLNNPKVYMLHIFTLDGYPFLDTCPIEPHSHVKTRFSHRPYLTDEQIDEEKKDYRKGYRREKAEKKEGTQGTS